MKDYLVLRVIAKLMIPFILLFALYVQFHSDFGPGGGFQAGVITAAAIIFYAIIFGLPAARAVVPDRLVETMVASGVLLYAGVGVAGLLLGGPLYLDAVVPARLRSTGQALLSMVGVAAGGIASNAAAASSVRPSRSASC